MPVGKKTIGAVLLAVLLVALDGMPANAQSDNFGKNKVQYTKFSWSYLQTDHFDIYFSEGGRELAEFTALAAESAYTSISTLFRYQLVNRVPLIVYNSHNDFQQTNVISEYLEEGIGGVTELFKNRVVVPFEGDYRKFRHVIHHELVHAVINDMFYGGSIQSIISNNITLQFPLWFSEGLAEYEALRWDTDSDMFIRDATVHEYLPPINRLYGYFAYRGGQSVFWLYRQQIRRTEDRRDPEPDQEHAQCRSRHPRIHRAEPRGTLRALAEGTEDPVLARHREAGGPGRLCAPPDGA